MTLSTLTSNDLKQVAKLLEQKEVLLAQVARINSELDSFEAMGKSIPRNGLGLPVLVNGLRSGRARRGQLTETILELLKGAGPEGISIAEISSRSGVKGPNISVWFGVTGKKFPEIEKVNRGVYRWAA
jgi:hypothetical protein